MHTLKNRKYTLSVVMIVKNEADNLKISLPAIADWADEIIVLDSGSTDNSKEVVQQYGGQWFTNTNWQGFGKQRQIAQSYATGDWILALDADEEVSPELQKSIVSIASQKPGNIVYGIKCLDLVFGHQIDSSLWPVKAHWRLYPSCFQFNDNDVHESIELHSGETQSLKGFVFHHTAPTPHFWLSKRLMYAETWAKSKNKAGKKTNLFAIIGKTLWAFIKQYVLDGRFLQGKYGFIYACLFTQYTFNKYALLYDMNKQPNTYLSDFEPHSINQNNIFDLPLSDKIGNKRTP